MDTEGGEGLSSALAETDIAQARLLGNIEDVGDGVGDVVPGKVVNGVVPEFCGVGVVVDGLFGVLVAAVVAEPDVEAEFDEGESERALRGGEAHPYLRVHEKSMVQIDDRLPG